MKTAPAFWIALTLLMPTESARGQSFTVRSIPSVDFGQIVAGTQDDSIFRSDPDTGNVTSISGAAVRRGSFGGRAAITVSCDEAPECDKMNALLTISAAGKGSNRAGPLQNLRVSTAGATAVVRSNPPSGSTISFSIEPVGRNSSKTFWLGFDLPIYGDTSPRKTGISNTTFTVIASREDGAGASSLTGLVEASVSRSLSIVRKSDLNFGRIVAPREGSGLVFLDPASGAVTVKGIGAVALPSPVPSAASFHVTGEGATNVSVSVAPSFSASASSGMLVMKTAPSLSGSQVLSGSLGSAGVLDFTVGATFEMKSSTPAGEYIGRFNVIVQYN